MKFALAIVAAAVSVIALAEGENPMIVQKKAVTASFGSQIVDGLAAKVNEEVITISDVMNEMRRDPDSRVLGGAVDNATLREIYKKTVDHMIDRKLIIRAATDAKMEMQDWVVDNRIREIVHNAFGGDINKLKEALAEDRISYEEWKHTIHDDLIVSAMRYQTIGRNLHASPGQMRAEYACHPEKYTLKAKLDVSVILLKPSKEGEPTIEERGAELEKRMTEGETFEDLARKLSADPNAKDGGKWKDVNPAEMFQPEVVTALNALKVGERSKLIPMNGWGFIIRKDAETEGKKLSFEEAYEKIEANVKEAQGKKLHERWMARLRDDALVITYQLPGMK